MRHRASMDKWTILGMAVWFFMNSIVAEARTAVRPGFNLFTPKQDIELGREASQQAEKQLALLNDSQVNRYVTEIGLKLAAKSMRPDYPWSFKVVNDSAINAFALPGGFIYVHRGALEAADNEAQIAGVIGHEIGHVVARHGTNQMSKALLPQLGLTALGGLTSGKGGWGAALARYGLPVGANLYFLKNSRQAENQADLLGTQEMTDVGYDPHQLAAFFEKLEQSSRGNASGAAAWFSDHPSPENRVENIGREIGTLQVSQRPVVDTKEFDQIKSRLKSMPPPPKPPATGSKAAPGGTPQGSASSPSAGTVSAPSGNYAKFSPRGDLFVMDYPSEWHALSSDGSGVTFAPEGGIQEIEQRADIVVGVRVSLFEPEGHSGHHDSLETMTDQYVGSLLQGHNYLREVRGSQQKTEINGQSVIGSRLEGKPPSRSESEVVWVATRLYDDRQLFAIACIAPQSRFQEFEPVFRHMIESVRMGP